MWICLNDGFLSIVQIDDNPGMLQVRARKRSHLESFLRGSSFERNIFRTPDRDYHWRVSLGRSTVVELLERQVLGIDYSNFKASVQDPRLHDMYATWWSDHERYQRREHSSAGST